MDDITYFAETNYRNERRRFGIKNADRRRHMYVIGKTGTGKTTLLDNMTIQDIQRGNGVCVIDPHGEYAERMLSFVPASRVDDVVYFNPNDLEYPLGFNMLEKPADQMRHFVASGLMGVFKKLWPDVWSARMEYFLSNSILAHLEMPDSTLLGVNRIFGDKAYRKSIVQRIHDPIVKAFWENEFAKLPEQFMREAVAAIQNKVGQFISNPLIRNIIGQTGSTFNLREIMDRKKILIANLAKGKVGEENSKLLGAMLVTRIYLAAMSRVDMSEDEREDFYVYVDEFQNFATESFAGILSEARKYHLDLTLANQYMAQLVDDKTKSAVLRDAVIGNVGTMISFRIGAEDAEMLEKEFAPDFMIQDFVSLGFAEIYLKLMIDGVASHPFSARTLPPIPAPPENYSAEIIKRSREHYGREVHEIERSIIEWSGSVPLGISIASQMAGAVTTSQSVSEAGSARTPLTVAQSAERGRKRESVLEKSVQAARLPDGQGSASDGKSAKGGEKKLYPAICAVDGEPTMVPFQPDGRRPVYCTEHLSQIQRGAGGDRILMPAAPASQSPQSSQANPAPSQPARREERWRNPEKREERQNRSQQSPPKKPVDLEELRKVLRESMPLPASSQPPATSYQRPAEESQSKPAPREEESRKNSGTIKPGETIKFD